MGSTKILIVVLLGWVCGVLGYTNLERVDTDSFSEQIVLSEAMDMAQGIHTWGIVRITHYPNGPNYFLVPFLKWGFLDPSILRLFPLGLSIFSFMFFVWCFVKGFRSGWDILWVTIYSLFLVVQPAFFLWQGALHQHSYHYSICLILAGLAAQRQTKSECWWVGSIGFLAGWIGYDFFFCQWGVFLSVRWARHYFLETQTVSQGIKKALLSSGVFVVGYAVSIGSHFVQIVLADQLSLGSLQEFIGTIGVRAGYGQDIPPPRWEIAVGMTRHFLATTGCSSLFGEACWSLPWSLVTFGLLTIGWWIARHRLYGFGDALMVFRDGKGILVLCGLTLVICWAWFFVMPQHAYHHYHFLPRHLWVGLLVIGSFPALQRSL